MTDRELLIKDLCARLPYGVKGIVDGYQVGKIIRIQYNSYIDGSLITIANDDESYEVYYDTVKPYLFPLSSMTEKQREEYNSMITEELMEIIEDGEEIKLEYIDWLNSYHFDYRGLIKRGLAIDCTNLNIY